MRRAGTGMRPRAFTPACAVLAVLLAGVASAEIIDRVMALVDGHLITLSDVRRAMTLHLVDRDGTPAPEAVAIERLIDRVLILQEVERYAPPEPEGAMVDTEVREVERRLGSSNLASTLSNVGASEPWLRQWVRDDLRMRAYIEQRFAGAAEPSDEELENYFRQHPDEFARNGQEMTDAAARELARTRVMASRRQVLVNDWLTGLRRRAEIVRPAAR
jgi:hypothetical protein